MNEISANLARVRDAIATAAAAAGRQPEFVKLIAVSKTHAADAIELALAAGQRTFGESTIQEALTKIPALEGQGIEWHFIGHLQSNKAKFVPGHFSWIHSLDNFKLAQRVSRLAQENGVTINALIEVNATRDPKKHGVSPEGLLSLIEELLDDDLPGIALRGLMAVGPHPATEGEMRAAFAAVRELRDECQRRFGLSRFTELSLGMSGDYVHAIKEGSTMVRVGTAIFGERAYRTSGAK